MFVVFDLTRGRLSILPVSNVFVFILAGVSACYRSFRLVTGRYSSLRVVQVFTNVDASILINDTPLKR